MLEALEGAEAVEAAPGSIRELADEAGVSDTLIRLVRDGDRRLTPATRDALADALRRWGARCEAAAEGLASADVDEPKEPTMHHATEMNRAERYAVEEMGWRNAEAIDARAAGRDDRSVAALIDPGVEGDDGRFVVAFDERGEIATDAGIPAEFGWDDEPMFR